MVTLMNERLGIQPHVVEAVVNHTSGAGKRGIVGVYNRALYLDHRRDALQSWEDHLQGLIGSDQKHDVAALAPQLSVTPSRKQGSKRGKSVSKRELHPQLVDYRLIRTTNAEA